MEAIFRMALLLHVGLAIAAAVHGGGAAQLGGHRLAHLRGDNEERQRLPAAVADFLHTGDSSALEQANCSRRFELLRGGRSPENPHRSALDAVLHAANFLSLVLQANRSREQSVRRDVEWYHALVRSLLLGEQKIHRAVVAFSSDGPGVHLQATRAGGEIVLRDLSGLHNRSRDGEWYHGVKHRRKTTFQKKMLSQDFAAVHNSLRRGESLIPDKTHVKWSAPYLECDNGNFVPRWLLTLSAAFYGLRPNMAPEFRGVVRVDINLQDVDIDQCATDGWFAGTHGCNLTTMECLPTRGHGFVLDKYKCHCKKGFYHPNRLAVTGAGGRDSGPNMDESPSSDCLPCRPGCAYCKDDTPCAAGKDETLRTAVISFQSLCVLVVFVSMMLVYHFRRNKSIRASGLVLLEAILCGTLLLYFPVGILYFQPSVFRCILLRWVRLLGYATVYGTLTLKLYSLTHIGAHRKPNNMVLKVFLSRTAQRIPYLTSWRVLRLLAIILLIVCWFLVAWTSAVCQVADRKLALIDVGYTPNGLQFSMCLLDRWDYMMAVAEFLFLLWAVYLCYAVRTVPSAFHEPRYMAIAVHNELILSAIFYVIRFTLAPELHPDWMLLLFFTHTHLTVTVTLGLLLIPKFLFAGTQMRDDIASEAYEDELDMGRSGSYLNSSITSAWSEHSLDPEDIRTPEETGPLSSINGCGVRSCDSLWEKRTNEELKKLYSQLEIYKRKKMLANNPHLQKKRSSKKGLGRSLMRRITEIPESVHRQCSREEKDGGEHGSNRNSICVLKKNPFDQTHPAKQAKEETPKNKVFSLKKSHSSYDHVRDPSEDSSSSATDKTEVSAMEGSLLDALMGKKLVKKKSRENLNAPSESTESVPLVCKSASAHNLTADKKPLHPRASMLQKSLSVIATAKEKTLGLAGKTQSAEDGPKKAQPRSKDESESKNLSAKSRNVKQPAVSSDPVKGKDLYNVSEVCPWEVEDLPTPSENKVQKHVSIAPEETTTVHGGNIKGGKAQKQTLSDPNSSGIKHSKEAQWTNTARADVCPWEAGGTESQSGPAFSPNKTDGEPPSKAENAKSNRAEVCPWDFGEPTVGIFPAMTVYTPGRNTIPDVSKTASSLKVEVCPWDNPASPSSEGMPSPSRSSKPKESPSKKKGSRSTRTLEKDKSKDGQGEKSRTTAKDKSKSPEKRQKLAEVCPWDADGHQEAAVVEKRKSANVGAAKVKKAEVCPWDFEDVSEKSGSDKSAAARRSNPDPAKKADVCPWDFDDKTA
ncbi:probable G-protein coupled receptor 158 [Hippocampus zosterae]|uniref:probable G-protein coupled receptor 158 n=1 Tax=Hippocampus zosterae TaxID=109293 RepID=UPI00223D3CE0|nr:probable G-protein coupled receptor 158 [Hippocampus zosterae]